MKIINPSVMMLSATPGAIQLLEAAGRTAYKSEALITDDSAGKFVRMVKSRKHESVLEHASATFRVVCDRGVSHEIVRHRIGVAYTQESTRYCNYGSEKFGREITVIRPPFWAEDDMRFVTWRVACECAQNYYFNLLDRGASPQEARSVLPNSLKTEIVMTLNFRAWLHFFELRTAASAHPQMQQIAKMVQSVMVNLYPEVFS